MKTSQIASAVVAFTTTLLVVAGCNKPGTETTAATADAPAMTADEKQAIETEVAARAKALFANAEKLDIEQCMMVFENTPDFLAVNPDGTFGNYNALKKLNADGFAQMSKFRATPQQEAIRILSPSLVLYTVSTGQEATLKTGQHVKYDHVGATMLFTKINGAWKATFYQESSSAPVAVN